MIETLRSNLVEIQQRIAAAAAKSGRAAEDITLVGVTKYVDAETTRTFFEAGYHVMGESRPQQLWQKAAVLEDLDIDWHLIGHLQRNKIKRTLPLVSLIHSIDSLRLLKAINATAIEQELTANVLLEINVSGEAAKHGFRNDDRAEIESVIELVGTLPGVKVQGLMAMAGLSGTLDDARREFIQLRQTQQQLQSQSLPANVSLTHLSMGMSGDYEVAIEEGATLVRVGSALFQGIS